MEHAELFEIIEAHRRWLCGKPDGECADLYRADANLTDANLTDADLSGANLHGANLHGADLRGADLRDASLSGAILTDANLTDANLTDADLSGANLHGANLHGADLRGADLRDASLSGARGIAWGCIAPVGQGRRVVSAWAHPSLAEPLIAGGCYRGTFSEFRAKVTAETLPWDWAIGSPEQIARWRAECLAAADLLADLLERAVT